MCDESRWASQEGGVGDALCDALVGGGWMGRGWWAAVGGWLVGSGRCGNSLSYRTPGPSRMDEEALPTFFFFVK